MMSLDTPQMSEFLALTRQVKTDAGAEKYNRNIGDEITGKSGDQKEPAPTVSVVRLQSIHRQMLAAKKAGDTSQVDKLRQQFQSMVMKMSQQTKVSVVNVLGQVLAGTKDK